MSSIRTIYIIWQGYEYGNCVPADSTARNKQTPLKNLFLKNFRECDTDKFWEPVYLHPLFVVVFSSMALSDGHLVEMCLVILLMNFYKSSSLFCLPTVTAIFSKVSTFCKLNFTPWFYSALAWCQPNEQLLTLHVFLNRISVLPLLFYLFFFAWSWWLSLHVHVLTSAGNSTTHSQNEESEWHSAFPALWWRCEDVWNKRQQLSHWYICRVLNLTSPQGCALQSELHHLVNGFSFTVFMYWRAEKCVCDVVTTRFTFICLVVHLFYVVYV